jgi:ankyrin repeat domain-containing protein 50
MPDPFSAAGTVVGIVSLGLQVCHGVIQYYDAWRSQDADVRNTCDLIASLEAIFSSLRAELETKPLGNGSLTPQVKESISRCEHGITELQKRLEKVQIKSSDPSSKLKLSSLDAQRRRLLYPFRQGTLGKFRDMVLEMRNNLGPLLATYNL